MGQRHNKKIVYPQYRKSLCSKIPKIRLNEAPMFSFCFSIPIRSQCLPRIHKQPPISAPTVPLPRDFLTSQLWEYLLNTGNKIKSIFYANNIQNTRISPIQKISLMNQLQNHILSDSQKSFLDDCSSMSSSTVARRITRKKDERSSSRRSLSRNSSERSQESMNLSQFYVKMTPSKGEKGPEPHRPVLLKRSDEATRLKRRSPTPVAGRIRNPKQNTAVATKQDLSQIQGDILIAQLQRELDAVKQQNGTLQKRMATFERQLKIKIKKIQELENKNGLLAEKEQLSSRKLLEYQQIVTINENNLNEARNNLERLRGIIKKNRCNELEVENAKLKKENEELKRQLRQVGSENTKNKEVISELQTNLRILQRENEKLSKEVDLKEKNEEIEKLKRIISTSKSEKEEKLEELIKQKKESQHRLKLKAEKLEINLIYLHRKKNQEIDKLKEKNALELNRMRSKLCLIHSKCQELKLECEKLRSKNNMFSSVQLRRSLNIDTARQTEDFFLFDLSP